MTLENEEEQVVEPTTEEVVEEQPEEQEEAPNEEESAEEGSEEPAEEAGDPDEVVVTLGDEPAAEEEPPEAAAKWVRELRKSHREATKEARELRKELEALKAKPAAQEEEVGAEPTLESCDYDEERFKADWRAWNKRADEKKELERKKQEEGVKAQAAWQATLENYGKRKTELKVGDFEDAEAVAQEILSVTQQGVIVSGADNPAVVVYALGKNPKKAKELAAITDPVKFAFAVAKLEKDMKVTPRKTAPIPESTVRSNARVSAGVDSTLERLRAEADRTGDRTKVAQYMRQQAAKKKA